jgi:hypothetical protein
MNARTLSKRLIILASTLFIFFNVCMAEEYLENSSETMQEEVLPGMTESPDIRSPMELALSICVLVFGLALVCLIGFIAYKEHMGWAQEVTRAFTLAVIVTAGLFLITAGYGRDQIDPMMGLLGTIAGYILGRSSSAAKEEAPKSKQ